MRDLRVLILITFSCENKELCDEQILDIQVQLDSVGQMYYPIQYTIVTNTGYGGTNYYYGITRLYQYGECYP